MTESPAETLLRKVPIRLDRMAMQLGRPGGQGFRFDEAIATYRKVDFNIKSGGWTPSRVCALGGVAVSLNR